MEDEYNIETDITNFDDELEDLNSDIERLLEANETTSSQTIIDSNVEKISQWREEYFEILDQRALKETELEDLIAEHNRERADEKAYDERAAAAVEANEGFNAAYLQSIEDYQAASARVVEIQGKIDDYSERQEAEVAGSEGWERFQLFL
jgi:chromosome segregation ATPase